MAELRIGVPQTGIVRLTNMTCTTQNQPWRTPPLPISTEFVKLVSLVRSRLLLVYRRTAAGGLAATAPCLGTRRDAWGCGTVTFIESGRRQEPGPLVCGIYHCEPSPSDSFPWGKFTTGPIINRLRVACTSMGTVAFGTRPRLHPGARPPAESPPSILRSFSVKEGPPPPPGAGILICRPVVPGFDAPICSAL